MRGRGQAVAAWLILAAALTLWYTAALAAHAPP